MHHFLSYRLAAKLPLTTFSSVKRLIGRPFDDPVVKEEARRLPYGVGRDEEGAVTLECPGVSSVERGFLYPEEVSAQILARLISDAEAFTSAPPGSIKKAIISVPAYFDAKQRQATMDAGQLAGLETVRILREPVAAALAYGLDLKRDSTVLVFDLGGGTYDVSILEVRLTADVIHPRSLAGDTSTRPLTPPLHPFAGWKWYD